VCLDIKQINVAVEPVDFDPAIADVAVVDSLLKAAGQGE